MLSVLLALLHALPGSWELGFDRKYSCQVGTKNPRSNLDSYVWRSSQPCIPCQNCGSVRHTQRERRVGEPGREKSGLHFAHLHVASLTHAASFNDRARLNFLRLRALAPTGELRGRGKRPDWLRAPLPHKIFFFIARLSSAQESELRNILDLHVFLILAALH